METSGSAPVGAIAVRCLRCGAEYELVERAASTAGCPTCGHSAWIAATVPLNGGRRTRSDPPRSDRT